MRWGLIPSWAKEPSIGAKMINARGETVAEKPAFRGRPTMLRCILVASIRERCSRDNQPQRKLGTTDM